MLRRLLVAFVATLIAWLGLGQQWGAVASTPASTVVEYTYDDVHHTSVMADTATVRGPPTVFAYVTDAVAVGKWSDDASVEVTY